MDLEDAAQRLEGIRRSRLRAIENLASMRLRRTRKETALKHPILWGRVYAPEWLPLPSPEFHWEMLDSAMVEPRGVYVAPRGFAKTTLLIKLLPIWSAMADPQTHEVLVISATADMTESWIGEVKQILTTSPEFLEDWGDIKGDHFGDSDVEIVLRGVKDGRKNYKRIWIRARGRGCQIRGRRPDRVFVDDLDDEDTVSSEKVRDNLWDWFWGTLINVLDTAHKPITVGGTAITDKAVVSRIMNSDKLKNWHKRCWSCYAADNRSLWPEKWSVKDLESRREEIGTARFAAEFLNAPLRNKGAPFTWKHIKTNQEEMPTTGGYCTLCVDPAVTGFGDPWAISVVRQVKSRVWYVLEAQLERATLTDLIERIFSVAAMHRPRAIGVETSANQSSLKYLFDEEQRKRGVRLPFVWLHHTSQRSKHARIMELLPLFDAGRIIIRHLHHELKDEIINYPKGHDDLLDCLAMHLEVQRSSFVEDPARTAAERDLGPWSFAAIKKRTLETPLPTDLQPSRWDRYLTVKG